MTEIGTPRRLVLARDAEQLLLGLVAQLALPEAHGEVGHHGRPSGHARVALQDVPRTVGGHHPVVEGLARGRAPDRAVLGERGPAYRGIVPEKAVAEARQVEGNARLRVAVSELELGALQIEVGLLVLPHAEYPLVGRERLEPGRDLVVAADDGAELARLQLEGRAVLRQDVLAVAQGLRDDRLPARAEEGELPRAGDLGPDRPVRDRGPPVGDLDPGPSGPRNEGPILVGHCGPFRGPHPQRVRPPGLDPKHLMILFPREPVSDPAKNRHASALLYPLTAPLVSPLMMYFCMKTKIRTTGTIVTTAKALR